MTALFNIVEIEQGSAEWHEFRKYRIGASEVAAIMGYDEYCTPLQLWLKKIEGIKTPDNAHMRRGREREPLIRQAVNNRFLTAYRPIVAQSVDTPFMIASLDGYDPEARQPVLEIKAPLIAKDEVSASHFCQCQAQMYCTDTQTVLYVQDDGTNFFHVPILRDEEFIEKMLEKCREFHEKLLKFVEPDPTDFDVNYIKDEDALKYLSDYNACKKIIQDTEEEMKKHKELFLKYCSRPRNIIGNTFVTKVIKKGAVKYKDIPELEHIDLDLYRGDNITYWLVK